ncbi:MAG: NAD(+) kinase [Gammaproteobacteria bacterium]|nr:NAD(+) kinase [Gammaproteobacteria bacterium]
MDQFRNIGLIGRRHSDKALDTVRALKKFLLGRQLNVILSTELAELIPECGLQVCSSSQMGEACDLVIVVGGDGCILGAARALVRFDVPVLGINRGHLGFLADIAPEEIEQKLTEVLSGKFTREKRFLLEMSVRRDGMLISEGHALNDVVLNRGKTVRMLEFELYIDGNFVYNQRSDGLIVSTPTGSTAYALSGGGPIMHPALDALVLVPMFPHTLSSRPIVIDGKSEIKIVVSPNSLINPQVNCDGQPGIEIAPNDIISIRKKPHKLELIHPLSYDFYGACRSKLGWSSTL